ncbi:MAG: hypothetical protein IMZ52_06240 [Actinobacteria bacterium]|nr:hypothetical protein [Actinomycetota bacterium]MBE3114665.1 hypothetical protein [Actinomycetota bacterium]
MKEFHADKESLHRRRELIKQKHERMDKLFEEKQIWTTKNGGKEKNSA